MVWNPDFSGPILEPITGKENVQPASLLLKGLAGYARRILSKSPNGGGSRPEAKSSALLISADRRLQVEVQKALQETWDVLLGKNMQEALALWPGREIGIVLLDRDTLQSEWRAAVSYLAGSPHRACVIVLSRTPSRNDWEEVVKLGGYELLCGPFDSENLLRAVRSGWSYYQSQESLRMKKASR